MICPNCECEYVDVVTTCPDCDIELITKEEFEGNLVHHSDWIVVYTTGANFEAEMFKNNLEGAGIEALVLGQKDRNFPAVGDLAVIKLLVRKKDADTALEIIEDINSQKDDGENDED